VLLKTIISVLIFGFLQTVYATTDRDQTLQEEVLIHINNYRQHHGLSKLIMDNRLVREAKQHSLDMAIHKMPFGHKDFEHRIARLHTQIKHSNAAAENVAYNYKDAPTVVEQWLHSPGHKRNIVGNYTMTGIGVARDHKGRIYYTQIFLRRDEKNKKQVLVRHPFFGVSFKRTT
jgi:uncharacterized protein YkwD